MISLDELMNQGEDAESGPSLREVVRRLTTPILAGFVLTKQSLGTLAASLELPVGFGERAQMLTGMFRAAAELGRLPALIEGLDTRAAAWDQQYGEWAVSHPASASTWLEWQRRVAETRRLLAEMLELARTAELEARAPSGQGPLPRPLDGDEDYVD